jgi:hypothetical protein
VIAKEAIESLTLLLMAIEIPDLDAIEVILRIISHSPRARIAINDDLARDTARIFEAMRHGLLDVVDLSEKSVHILDKIATRQVTRHSNPSL